MSHYLMTAGTDYDYNLYLTGIFKFHLWFLIKYPLKYEKNILKAEQINETLKNIRIKNCSSSHCWPSLNYSKETKLKSKKRNIKRYSVNQV